MSLESRLNQVARKLPVAPLRWVRPRILLPGMPDDYLVPQYSDGPRIEIPEADTRERRKSDYDRARTRWERATRPCH
jgi:hypothetical protein